MAIIRRKVNGRVYLEERKSVRVNGKVKSIYVRRIGPENPVRQPNKPKPKVLDRLKLQKSSRAGDVAVLWELAKDLRFTEIIDGICCDNPHIEGPSPGKFLTAWAINRVVDPLSATKLESWVPSTDLPRLSGIEASDFTKEAFLSSLDFVCNDYSGQLHDLSPRVDEALYRRWREIRPLNEGELETLAYDLTSVLFFGVSCPLAELGYNPKKVKRRQVNLALVVSRREKYPLTHFVYEGNRKDVSTIKNLMVRLEESSVQPGTLIWDRGNVSQNHVKAVEKAGWHLICGLPKTLKTVRDLIDQTYIPPRPQTLARYSKAGHIYAVSASGKIYGRKRRVVLYTNRERGVREAGKRHEALSNIAEALDSLSEEGADWTEKKLHEEIKKLVKGYSDYFDVRVSRKKGEPRVVWKYRTKELKRADAMDGKWLLLSTDESLTPKEVVNTYLEKDFIEKVFRTLKTSEEIEPVRHRLENRVRAYLFMNLLAYRLLAVLQHKLRTIDDTEDTWERADSFLQALAHVQRVPVKLGHEVKTWYLNLQKKTKDTLKRLHMDHLFDEQTCVEM